MCGRFVRKETIEEIAKKFEIERKACDLPPSYNIAPTQSVAAIVHKDKARMLVDLKWGLVPPWSKDTSFASKLINARAETISEKASFKQAFKNRRCLIISNGFYEWQKSETGKQPTFIHLPNQELFVFAGLYEHWKAPEGGFVSTCTIITTQASEILSPIHHRMPVILPPEQYDFWLSKDVQDKVALSALLKAYPDEQTAFYPVSDLVNNARNNSPQCLEAA